MLLLQSLSYKDAFPQTMALPSVASGKSNRRLSYPSSGIWLIFWLVFTFPNNLQSENQKGWQRLQRLPLLSDTAALQGSGEQQRTKLLDVGPGHPWNLLDGQSPAGSLVLAVERLYTLGLQGSRGALQSQDLGFICTDGGWDSAAMDNMP